jgi:hypothetical protein
MYKRFARSEKVKMSGKYQILNTNKYKYNQESLGKKSLKIRLRKSKQKEAKKPK